MAQGKERSRLARLARSSHSALLLEVISAMIGIVLFIIAYFIGNVILYGVNQQMLVALPSVTGLASFQSGEMANFGFATIVGLGGFFGFLLLVPFRREHDTGQD